MPTRRSACVHWDTWIEKGRGSEVKAGLETGLARSLVAVAVAFNLMALHSEFLQQAPDFNDLLLHELLVSTLLEAWQEGRGILDVWVPYVSLGYPVWHVYQPFPHLTTAVLAWVTGVSAETLVYLLSATLLSLFPLSVFAGARWMGLHPLHAACNRSGRVHGRARREGKTEGRALEHD